MLPASVLSCIREGEGPRGQSTHLPAPHIVDIAQTLDVAHVDVLRFLEQRRKRSARELLLGVGKLLDGRAARDARARTGNFGSRYIVLIKATILGVFFVNRG